MIRILYITAISCISFFGAHAQRRMELVSQPFTENFRSVEFDNGVVLASATATDPAIYTFTEMGLARYPYPVIGGTPLQYYTASPLVSYLSAVYIVLSGPGGGLYSFDGMVFHDAGTPWTIVSNLVVYGSYLYMLCARGDYVQLYRFDGSLFEEIPSATLDGGGAYDLRVAGRHLYFSVTSGTSSTMNRYDGTSIYTFPPFGFHSRIENIYEIESTGQVYFFPSGSIAQHIFYFDGSSVVHIHEGRIGSHFDAVLWRDNLYFINPDPYFFRLRVPLMKAEGNVLVEIPLPAGKLVFANSGLVTFNDGVYVHVTDILGNTSVLRYDGSFTNIFDVPNRYSQFGPLFVRGGKLLIQPEINIDTLYEYDGTGFTTIMGPRGYFLPNYQGSTPCNSLWSLTNIPVDIFTQRSLWKERNCPFTETVSVIPRYFLRFNTFFVFYSARLRKETWSSIDAGWELYANCQEGSNCTPPVFSLTLSDAQDKIVWQNKFDKPFIASVPVEDKIPLKTTLSATEKSLQDLIQMDADLVEKGIDGISISINPKDETFLLGASTMQGNPVTLKVDLLNKEGKSIWQKEFKAPFVTTIKDKINERGEMLRFSIADAEPPKNAELNTKTTINYLNPTHGSLTINMSSNKQIREGEISVTTILGQKLISKKINSSRFNIDLPPYQPGLFVITIRTEKGEVLNRVVRLR